MDSFVANERAQGCLLLTAHALCRAIALCLLVHAVVFCIFDLLPEAAFSKLGTSALQRDALIEMRSKLGTEGPLLQRYTTSVRHLLSFELGNSLMNDFPVAKLIGQRFKMSLATLVWGILFSCGMMWAGSRFYCHRKLSAFRRVVLQLVPAAMMPQFVVSASFAVIASSASNLFPGVFVTNTLHIVSVALMPSCILFSASANTALAIAGRPFVTTYISQGFPWQQIQRLLQANVFYQMIPLANRACLALLTGTVFSELAFDRPGIGSVFADAIRSGDQPVAFGWMLAVSIPFVFISQVVALWTTRLPPQ